MATGSYKLDKREHATVLAALRTYQRRPTLTGEAADMIQDIATDGGELDELTNEEIDALCERINTDGDAMPPLAIVMEGGLIQCLVSTDPSTFGDIIMIDYDLETVSEHDDAIYVPQEDGSETDAYVSVQSVEVATIDLPETVMRAKFVPTSDNQYENAARARGWTHGGDGDGVIYNRSHYESWKAAVSWSGDGSENDAGPVYASWEECCAAEDIEVSK